MQREFIYLDNNATTRTCDEAMKVMKDWIQSCSNPSGESRLASAGKILLNKARSHVDKLCNLGGNYHILFTSGATESNCTLIHMTIDAWRRNVGTTPHVISSSIEHKSILECLQSLEDDKSIELTLINPNMYGIVDPNAVEDAFQDNTALVTIMFANNELGSINPIRQIGAIAHAHNVPFHTDAVQIFGKIPIDVPQFNIDALSMSFHKMYGPIGVGLLLLQKKFVDGYGLRATMVGSQQGGLRGGTENVSGIAGATAALMQNFQGRKQKNKRLHTMRNTVIDLLGRKLPILDYREFYNNDSEVIGGILNDSAKKSSNKKGEKTGEKKGKALVVLGSTEKNSYLPSTVLLSVVDFDNDFCNVKFKKLLESHGIIVSIGSACNTNSKNASHVLQGIKAPAIIKRGVLRVSIGDYNTMEDIRKFARIFLSALQQM